MTLVARIEAKLRGLSGRERVLLLSGAAAVVLFALARWGAFPAIAEFRNARAAIPARREALARFQSVRMGQGGVIAEMADSIEKLENWEEGLLPGDDPSAAAAGLQGILKPRVARPDTRLTSIRTLAPVKRGDYAEVSVQMDLQTSTAGLAALLAEIPRERRILRVRKLTVNAGVYSPALANRPDALMVSIVVSGLARSPGDEKSAGGDE